jgi:chromate transport protein ChrA
MDHIKHLLDAISLSAMVATLVGMLPHIAALLSIIWTLLRIYETKTVQQWMNRWRK